MWKALCISIVILYASNQFVDDEVGGQEMTDENKQLFTIEPTEAEPEPIYPSDELVDPEEPFPFELNICS